MKEEENATPAIMEHAFELLKNGTYTWPSHWSKEDRIEMAQKILEYFEEVENYEACKLLKQLIDNGDF